MELAAAKRRIRQLETELTVSRNVNEVFLEQNLPPDMPGLPERSRRFTRTPAAPRRATADPAAVRHLAACDHGPPALMPMRLAV
jgi:hypothetical protein